MQTALQNWRLRMNVDNGKNGITEKTLEACPETSKIGDLTASSMVGGSGE